MHSTEYHQHQPLCAINKLLPSLNVVTVIFEFLYARPIANRFRPELAVIAKTGGRVRRVNCEDAVNTTCMLLSIYGVVRAIGKRIEIGPLLCCSEKCNSNGH